ncbi:head scaffolding protein [Pectobacterium phage Ymer]|uniref:Head scaffolding protein n=1 Tax=Pectobacterium phage Koroua TaxID=3158138 RepID=A0AB39ABJ4_9CAUD|nr:hypothetical protein Abuela_14 [Pectobacterium phage Abuela]
MPLDFIIKAEGFNALAEPLQKLYEKQADGNYQLSVNGVPQGNQSEVDALKKQVAELIAAGETSEKAAKEAAKQAKIALDEKARKDGDVAALEKSWQEKLDAQKAEYETKLGVSDGQLKTMLIDNYADALARELAGESASVILPHVKSRLELGTDDNGQYVTRITKDGKPSALTRDDLKKEFAENKTYAPILVGSQGAGSGGGLRNTETTIKPNDSGVTSLSGNSLQARAAQIASGVSS